MTRRPIQVLVLPFTRDAEDGTASFGILERADTGQWQGVAGGVEDGETVLGAALRELAEELVFVDESRLIPLDSHSTVPGHFFREYALWRDTYVVPEYAFGADVTGLRPRLSSEHRSIRWLPYEEALNLLTWDSNRTALWELSERIRADRHP